mmetsp:Transcript_75623/g.231454  ORF Transcript_75623/g.231454 Transcript_75623/m.231454 type:complete len:393 (-) Transcript_75623:174-1352(-)
MAAPAAERLAVDRWAEFHRLARSRGAIAADGARPAGAQSRELRFTSRLLQSTETASETSSGAGDLEAGRGGAASGFMREFFGAVSDIQSTLRRGRENVQVMDQKLEEVLKATTQDKQKAVSDELARLAEDTTKHITESKRGLEALKARAEAEDRANPSSAERRIRQNMQQAMARKHQQLLVDFQKAQVDFKQVLVQRQAREMQLLCPDATPEEVSEMIEAGQTSSQVVMRRMAGAHAMILEEVERIRDKHQDILRLEQSIQDLAQMFQEIAILVDAQGEMLDDIEKNVRNTVEYTAGGEKQLGKALETQRNTRKWQCCLSVCCFLLLGAVLLPTCMGGGTSGSTKMILVLVIIVIFLVLGFLGVRYMRSLCRWSPFKALKTTCNPMKKSMAV